MAANKDNPSNSDIYLILGEIKGLVEGVVEMQTKVIFALIALAGATLGLKLVKTSALIVISRYTNMFVFLFAALLGVSLRKKLNGWYFVLAYGIGGVAGNLVSLIGGEGPTGVFRVPIFIVANLSLLLFLWGWDKWEPKSPGGRNERLDMPGVRKGE